MTKLSAVFLAATSTLLLSACGRAPEVAVRATPTALAAGDQSAAFRVAEARGYFALGSIGLASEGFRRALREDPNSVDAMNGLAACYDQMGRFDLSRGFYERALALAPNDPRLYANLATSLTMQGKKAEADAVRQEMAARLKAGATVSLALAQPTPAPAIEAAAPAAPAAPSVSVPLPQPAPVLSAAGKPASGAHLERMNMAEVMLVTRTFAPVTPGFRSASAVRPAAPPVKLTVLNAARVSRLAANTRVQLQQLGWNGIAIGNAPQAADQSRILYPETRRAEAMRLSRQLGIMLHTRPGSPNGRLVVELGRDVARRRAAA